MMGEQNTNLIYLDNHATTRVDPEVVTKMLPYFSEEYGNAAVKSHIFGWKAEDAVDIARREVATLLGCEPTEIVFTSGATEANNLAIFGVASRYAQDKGKHIITQATEHPSVLEPLRLLAARGFEVSTLEVDEHGRINLEDLESAMRDDTVLVSVMAANNEIGTLQDVQEIGRICHDNGALFHCDATQAAGRFTLDVRASHIDLASISSHKFYGPKGAGALYVRRRDPRVSLHPRVLGGGHEDGIRAGTLNVPGIVGMGEAARLARVALTEEPRQIAQLRDKLQAYLSEQVPGSRINGHPTKRLAGNLNVSFPGIDGELLLLKLRGIAITSGAACASGSGKPSHVLRAIGISSELASSTLRFGLGRFTTEEQIEIVSHKLSEALEELSRESQSALAMS